MRAFFALHRFRGRLLAFAALIAAWVGPGLAHASDLNVQYSNGQRVTAPLIAYEGVDHISVQTLGRLLAVIDNSSVTQYEYQPKSLRLVVTGRNVSVNESHLVIEGNIRRPLYPLQVVDGQLLIPVDTVREISNELRLFELRESPGAPARTPAPTLTPPFATPPPFVTALPLIPGSTPALPATPTPGPTTPPPTPTPVLRLTPTPAPADPVATPLTPTPTPLASVKIDTPPVESFAPHNAREIAAADMAKILAPASVLTVARIAVLPEGASKAYHGGKGDEVQRITEGVAFRLQDELSQKRGLGARLPNTPSTPDNLDRSIEWINNSSCDALVALTLDTSPYPELQGIQIYTAHEASDLEARPPDSGPARGLPAGLNYVPFQDQSLKLARLIEEEMREAGLPVRPLQVAPSYLLRRAAMPSVMISLGHLAGDGDRVRLREGSGFTDKVAGALAAALTRYRAQVEEAGRGVS